MPIIADQNPNTVPEGEERPNFAPVEISTDIQPQRVKVDQVQLHAKMRCFAVTSRQIADLEFRFQDYKGNPYNLTTRPDESRFEIRFVEAVIKTVPRKHRFRSVAIDIIDEEQGLLSIKIPANDTGIPGIYMGELALVVGEPGKEEIIHSNMFILYIAQGMFFNQKQKHVLTGPPTMQEVRARLRDATPEENYIIDGYMYQDAEIAQAAINCLQYWNEAPPLLKHCFFSSESFPEQFNWMEGILGQLLLLSAESYRKNHIEYAGGGLSVNDMAKEPNFIKAGMERWNNYREFVRLRKQRINVDRGWSTYYSKYMYINGWSGGRWGN